VRVGDELWNVGGYRDVHLHHGHDDAGALLWRLWLMLFKSA
jgi:hypothetical protein